MNIFFGAIFCGLSQNNLCEGPDPRRIDAHAAELALYYIALRLPLHCSIQATDIKANVKELAVD